MPLDVRSRVSLDGTWDLTLLDRPGQPQPVPVEVPGSWTLQVPGAELARETVRYSRTVRVPAEWDPADPVLLCFGAVNHAAEVSVDGHVVGRHEGGWTPFEVPLDRGLLTGGSALLEVVVRYPALLAEGEGEGGDNMQEWPHGKQTWYGTNAGIWQPVTLERRARTHVVRSVVAADVARSRVTARVTLSDVDHVAGTPVRLSVRVAGSTGVVARSDVLATSPEVRLAVGVLSPLLWSVETPHLYDVTVEVLAGDVVVDAHTVAAGFRTVDTADGQIRLNGRPVEIRGVLDQDYHAGSELRPRTAGDFEELFARAKALGFNLLRCHMKRPDPAYFEAADRLGMLVWAEMPSWQRYTERSAATAAGLLTEMIHLDGHHPSIVAWNVVNEGWGVDMRDPEQRAWMVGMQQRIKALAPQALVVDNSACESNYHVLTDIEDYHAYRGIPERRAAWDEFVDEFAGRADWTYTPFGDAQRRGDEPLVVSEFGNWGLPDMRDFQDEDGADPWWARLGERFAFGAAHATGVVDRFESLGLRPVFGSWEAFVRATQDQQLLATRYQIGSMRRRPEIAGYVLTQLTDVQWEANGLFDMNGRPRTFVDELALVNGPCAVVLRPAAWSGTTGAMLEVTVDVVPPRSGVPAGTWTVVIDQDGREPQEFGVRAGTRDALHAKVRLPERSASVPVRASLLVDGELVARDVADIAVVAPAERHPATVHTDDAVLTKWLTALNVPVTQDPAESSLLVTRRFGPEAQAHARAGGRVLVVAEDSGALAGAFAAPLLARLSPREGDGDWVPRFDWLRRSGPFAALPGGPLLDLSFENLIGDLVIDFLPAPLRPAHLHSAVFAGWLRHSASTSLTVPWSKGAVTLTTFRLRTAGTHDPVAVALTRAMIDVARA